MKCSHEVKITGTLFTSLLKLKSKKCAAYLDIEHYSPNFICNEMSIYTVAYKDPHNNPHKDAAMVCTDAGWGYYFGATRSAALHTHLCSAEGHAALEMPRHVTVPLMGVPHRVWLRRERGAAPDSTLQSRVRQAAARNKCGNGERNWMRTCCWHTLVML